MGENIQREWDDEPLRVKLWEALQAIKNDRDVGIAQLTGLANRGSALAMMHLGHTLVGSEDNDQSKQGEEWLIKSASGRSVEGRLQLAHHYERQKSWEKALAELKTLAGEGYSPAMYYLARLLYGGELGYRAVPEAVEHLKTGINAGHLPSMALLSQIYRKEKLGFSRRVASHWLCLTKVPSFVRCMWSYPNSDRLRPYSRFPGA